MCKKIFFGFFLLILSSAFLFCAEKPVLEKIKNRGFLIWGADAEGGAPYIFPDPKNPKEYIGFEVDLAAAIAKRLGVKAKHGQNAWDGLVPALERGDFDIAMNGIEITDNRKERILFSRPYYVYVEQLVVRKDEKNIKDINSLKGKKVGTLSGTVAQDILQKPGNIDVKIYSKPFRHLKKVLLPLPEGPINATTSPFSISKLIPLKR